MRACVSLSRSASIILAGSLVSFAPSIARAEGEANVDETARDPSGDRHRIDRTWLYLDDARIAAPLTAIGMSSVSYTSVGSSAARIYSPSRQFAGNTAQPGELVSLGGEVGLLRQLSVFATGQMGLGGEAAAPSAGVVAGARFQLLPPSMHRTHLVASIGYLREAWAAPVYSDETAPGRRPDRMATMAPGCRRPSRRTSSVFASERRSTRSTSFPKVAIRSTS